MRWLLLIAFCASLAHAEEKKEASPMLKVSSSAFAANGPIARKHAYKGEGENLSPALAWEGAPAATKSFVVICDDPDAPRADPWVHWVVYGIPGKTTTLAEAAAGVGVEGKNDFGTTGWGGPMPPKGHGTHHYHFKVYALDTELSQGAGQTKAQILGTIKGHVLAEGELVGTYERK